VGFTLSPVLWRKLPGSRSAGRVQSVALRLICERELEIEVFKSREYWTVEAPTSAPPRQVLTARLTHLDGKKLDKFDLNDPEQPAGRTRRRYRAPRFQSCFGRPPPSPPQPALSALHHLDPAAGSIAHARLYFSAPPQTMRIAQRLYEGVDIDGETVGLITYMRTDGVQLAARRSARPAA
jgi:DNA topoisomerase-1